jgi:hypothetical protein
MLDSLKGHDIKLHVFPDRWNYLTDFHERILAIRKYGFSLGTADLVTYVDDDDVVMPGIFRKIQEVMDANPEALACWSLEDWANEDMTEIASSPFVRPHHLITMRRDAMNSVINLTKEWSIFDHRHSCHVHMLEGLPKESIVAIDQVGYVWRRHESSLLGTLKRSLRDESINREHRTISTAVRKVVRRS